MSSTLFVAGVVSLYLSAGLIIAGLSMRVWRRSDSKSLAARTLFPWNAHDGCVGAETGLSMFGELTRHSLAPGPLYALLLALFWPMKLFWCLCTKIYVSFFYH